MSVVYGQSLHSPPAAAARASLGTEDGGDGVEAGVPDPAGAGVAAVHSPVQQGALVRVKVQKQHQRLPSQLLNLPTYGDGGEKG